MLVIYLRLLLRPRRLSTLRLLNFARKKTEQPVVLPTSTVQAAVLPSPTSQPALSRPAQPQIGVNFVAFYISEAQRGAVDTQIPFRQPDWIFNDFRALGVQAYRQLTLADLFWDVVEPSSGRFHFDQADTVIPNAEFEPIVTLFALQYASPTPPWETSPTRFQKTLGPEARAYLEQVIARYGQVVRYWEIGNEMDHWRAADPGAGLPSGAERIPLAPQMDSAPRNRVFS